jgi:ubiquinone/menaquinone biosynthesis C-methylase UbiE
MCVLDIGCGMGDVTMIAAQLVGSAGQVISIDLDQASIETAQRRAAAFGLENTSFDRADIAAYVPPNPFDAIIGRLVLQFVPNPIAIIERLYGMLRPGRHLGATGTDMEIVADIHSALTIAAVRDKSSA